MFNNVPLKEYIKVAKEIKKRMGVGSLCVEMSNSFEDHINKSIRKSNELLRKLEKY